MFKLDMQAIRESAKDVLLTANPANSANESACFSELAALAISNGESTLEPHSDPEQWRELARAYHDHHFKCRTCIAASQGVGLRCGIGSALWRAYSLTPPPKNALNPSARSGKEESHE